MGYLGVSGRMSRHMLDKCDVRMGIGLIWLTICTCGGTGLGAPQEAGNIVTT
jgi:hypothetical protein